MDGANYYYYFFFFGIFLGPAVKLRRERLLWRSAAEK